MSKNETSGRAQAEGLENGSGCQEGEEGGRLRLLYLRGSLAALLIGSDAGIKKAAVEKIKKMPPGVIGANEKERSAFKKGYHDTITCEFTEKQILMLCLSQKNESANRNTTNFIRQISSVCDHKIDKEKHEYIRKIESLIQTKNYNDGPIEMKGDLNINKEHLKGSEEGHSQEPPIPVLFLPCLLRKSYATITPLDQKLSSKWKWDGKNLYASRGRYGNPERWIWDGKNFYCSEGSNKDGPKRWIWDGKILYPLNDSSIKTTTWKWDGRNLFPSDSPVVPNRWTWDGKNLFPSNTGLASPKRWIIE